MSKAALVVFVKGLIFFFVGLFLTANGIPSDPASGTIMITGEVVDDLDQDYGSPHAQSVFDDSREALRNVGIGATIIGVLEMVLSFLVLVTNRY